MDLDHLDLLPDPDGFSHPHHTVKLLATILILGPLLIIPSIVHLHVSTKRLRHRSATVLVLGDIGRSPRMMYHAESFARHLYETAIIGYNDTPPTKALLENDHVHLLPLHNPPPCVLLLPWVVRAPIRVLYQISSVLYISLVTIPVHTEYLIVQNPPSIPTLALAQMIVWLTGAKLIIDWHNTGYSILGMRVGESSRLVRTAKLFEATFGRRAYAHLFVTKALKDYLSGEWGLRGRQAVLHDRPPGHFRRTERVDQHKLFTRLLPKFSPPIPERWLPIVENYTMPVNIYTTVRFPLPHFRTALIVSSTSWTADEDFTLLLTALTIYQKAKEADRLNILPRLLVIVTGKGALRSAFENAVAQLEASTWSDIVVRCVFLPAKDYPLLLGTADLGVSLHTSSSGRDLPMKVVDMFGCGLPVLAKGFNCIGELVKDGQNGRVFDTGEELGEQMVELLSKYPEGEELNALQAYFTPKPPVDYASTASHRSVPPATTTEGEEEWENWDDNWDRVVYQDILGTQER